MPYTPTTYVETGAPTDITAVKLNKGETGIQAAQAAAEAAQAAVDAHSKLGPAATGTDTAALNAAIASTPVGGTLLLRPGSTYVITDALTVGVAGVTIRLNGASIRQATWRKPVFDIGVTDDVEILGPGRLYSTETRTSGSGAVRGDDEDRYGSGVWSAGDRTTVRDISVDGMDSGVHLTNWTTGSTHAGRPVGSIVDNITVSNVDFGVLCVAQDSPTLTNIRGSYIRSTGSGDPAHLVYVTYYGGDYTRNVNGGNWTAFESAADSAFIIKFVRGATLSNLQARTCGGLLDFEACQDLTIDSLLALDDRKSTEAGTIFAADATSERVHLANVGVHKGVSGRAIRFTGIDCSMDNVVVRANRVAGVGAEDIQIGGVRTGISMLKHRNIGAANTGFEGILVNSTAVDCYVRDPDIRNSTTTASTQACIIIASGATGTMVLYDPTLLVPAATFNKITDLGTASRLITLSTSSGGTGGHTIRDEGNTVPTRTNLTFIGPSVTVTDNSGANSTDVTISATSLPSTVQTKTAAYTALVGDVVLANAAGGAFTVTLPTTPTAGTSLVTVKKTDSSTNVVTVAGTIDGDSGGATISTPQYGAMFQYVGADGWKIVSITSASAGTPSNSGGGGGGAGPFALSAEFPSIQAAIDSLTAGGTVLIPAGFHYLTTPLVFPNHDVTLQGMGVEATIIAKGADVTLVDIKGASASEAYGQVKRYIKLRDLSLNGGNNPAWSAPLWKAYYAQFCHCEDVGFRSNYGPATSTAMLWDTYFTRCRFDYCGTTASTTTAVCHWKSVDQGAAPGTWGGFVGNNTNNIWMTDCVLEQNRDRDIWFDGRDYQGNVAMDMNTVNQCRLTNIKIENAARDHRLEDILITGAQNMVFRNIDCAVVGGSGTAYNYIRLAGAQLVTFDHVQLSGNDTGDVATSACRTGIFMDGVASSNTEVSLRNVYGVYGTKNKPTVALVEFAGYNYNIKRDQVLYNNNPGGSALYSGIMTTGEPVYVGRYEWNWDPGAMGPAGQGTLVQFSAAGVQLGDFAIASFSVALPFNVMQSVSISGTNAIDFALVNTHPTDTINPGGGTIRVQVWRT